MSVKKNWKEKMPTKFCAEIVNLIMNYIQNYGKEIHGDLKMDL